MLLGGVPQMKAIRAESSLAEQVFGSIRRSIVAGQLVPGSLHSVQELAAELGVSRTPVREALIELAAQGMVRFERNRGVRILQTSIHDLEEIFALRLLLEVPATYRAAEHVTSQMLKRLQKHLDAMRQAAEVPDEAKFMEQDRRFHSALLESAGNRRLVDFIDRLRDLVYTRGVATFGRSRSMESVAEEHRRILGHLEQRDAVGAARAMHDHILHTSELIVQQEEGGSDTGTASWAGLFSFDNSR
jgi:DNA-binding GntR family transcriptional regulator